MRSGIIGVAQQQHTNVQCEPLSCHLCSDHRDAGHGRADAADAVRCERSERGQQEGERWTGEGATSEVMKTMFRLTSAVIRTQIRARRLCLGLLKMRGSLHGRDLQQGASRTALRSRASKRPGDGAVIGLDWSNSPERCSVADRIGHGGKA